MRPHPLLVLAAGAAAVVALEAARVETAAPSYRWLLLQAVVAGVALLLAWREQERLTLPGLLALAAAFEGALVAVDLGSGVRGDFDPVLYGQEGHALLHGRYPHSEYPTGAVLLFALESGLGGGAARTPNALLMIPCQLATVAAIWACRTRWSGWLAALVATWPLDLFFWEFRFDLLPTALLASGLVLALRQRLALAGVALGVGAAVKWTPALALAGLLVWLAASGRARDAVRTAVAAVAAFGVLTVPFLAWSPHEVLAAYSTQGGRTITGESLPYLPLHWLADASIRGDLTQAARVPSWANGTAAGVQLALVVAALALAALARGRPRSGVAVSALVPAVFLLTNRIFSPQFLVELLAVWAIAIALLARTRREQLALAAAAAAASLADVFVYPYGLPRFEVSWQVCSALVFALGLGLTGWLLRAAVAAPQLGGAQVATGYALPR